MVYLIAFVLLSIPILIISWKSFKNRRSHGFYRFFSWEAILVLLVFRIEYWFTDPFSIHQIGSWILLLISLFLVFSGVIMLKKNGKKTNRKQKDLYAFEKTSELVKTGIFKYIRHPMYSSLLILAWAVYLKNPDWNLFPVAVISSIFLLLTAIADEKECILFFGQKYIDYMKKTKRFIPFLF